MTAEDAQKLHAALYDALRRIAIARHDAVAERTVVHSYAHGSVVLAADGDKCGQTVVNLLQLGLVLLVGVVQMLELSCRVDIVSGVYPHLLGISRSHVGHVGVEVYVGHEGLPVAQPAKLGTDIAQVLSLTRALRGEPHQLASGIDDASGLCHRRLSVVGVGGSHRLYAYGIVASDGRSAHSHNRRVPPFVAR